jgi:hypothetical protein
MWHKAEKRYIGFYSEFSSLDGVCVKTRNLTLCKDTAVSGNEQMTIPTEVTRNLYQMSG